MTVMLDAQAKQVNEEHGETDAGTIGGGIEGLLKFWQHPQSDTVSPTVNDMMKDEYESMKGPVGLASVVTITKTKKEVLQTNELDRQREEEKERKRERDKWRNPHSGPQGKYFV